MKNKKKILSLIACLSLLSSCNRGTSSNSSCSITTSTPNSVTPSKTVEELNKELFENYAFTSTLSDGSLRLTGFKDDILEEYLNLETLIIPETINGVALTEIGNIENGTFSKLSNVKIIKIPASITNIFFSTKYSSRPSAFMNLPNLENIEVDSNNKWYYSKGNCLIEKEWNMVDGNRVPTGTFTIVSGWQNVDVPEEITKIRNYAFSKLTSIKSIHLPSTITEIVAGSTTATVQSNAFKYLDTLESITIDENNNKFKVEEGTNVLYGIDDKKIYAAGHEIKVPSIISTLVADNFANFDSINKMYIPNNVLFPSSSPYLVFRSMNNLKEVVVDDNRSDGYKIEPGTNVLYDSNKNIFIYGWGDIIIPSSITTLNSSNTSLYFSYSVTSIDFNQVTTTKGRLIQEMLNLTKIKFRNVATDIEPGFFYHCPNLQEVISESENVIVNDPYITNKDGVILQFYNLKNKTELIFPDYITSLPDSFLAAGTVASNLEKIVFNEGIKTIGMDGRAVLKSSKIKELVIPNSVEKISNLIFYYLYSLESFKVNNDFYECENNLLFDKKANKFISGFGNVDLSNEKDLNQFIDLDSNYIKLGELTISNKLTTLYEKNFQYSKFTAINFIGNEEEFKTCANSLLFTNLKNKNSSTTVNFMDENKTIISSKPLSQIS